MEDVVERDGYVGSYVDRVGVLLRNVARLQVTWMNSSDRIVSINDDGGDVKMASDDIIALLNHFGQNTDEGEDEWMNEWMLLITPNDWLVFQVLSY